MLKLVLQFERTRSPNLEGLNNLRRTWKKRLRHRHFSNSTSVVSATNSIKTEDCKRSVELASNDVVWNPCGVQMIPDKLFRQIFIDSFRQTEFSDEAIEKSRKHLQDHALWGQKVKKIPATTVVVPELQGEDINDHFRNIAQQQTFRYKRLLDELASAKIPEKPRKWRFAAGWTKYEADGTSEVAVSVPFPEEEAIVFDVEVCISSGQTPTLACAVTPKAWYSWCSRSLVDGNDVDVSKVKEKISLDDLIPLETRQGEAGVPRERSREKIVIGHNVSYDRARIKEQYFLKESKVRFMDTMSLHIAISGITSFQRALKMTAKAGQKTMSPLELRRMGLESSFLEWSDQSSLNNLADVYRLYCDEELDKSSRDIFVKGTLEDVRSEFQNLFHYCANDVAATKNVFSKLLPMFYDRFPHPVTMSGMLEMGTTYLPVNSNWTKYMENSERTFNEYENEMKSILMEKADEALKLLEGERYKSDPWLWDLDWKVAKRRVKSESGLETPLYPAWYRKLLYRKTDEDYKPGPAKISTSMQVVPKLLRLTWFGFPLHYTRKGGWGFLVQKPRAQLEAIEDATTSDENFEISLDDGEENESKLSSTFPYEEWLKVWENARESLLRRSAARNLGNESVTDVANRELRKNSEQSAEELDDFIKGLQSLSAKGLWNKDKKGKKKGAVDENQCSPHPKCIFIPLPHKDGPSNRVGNPLAKDFLSKIDEGVLTSADGNDVANKVVRLSKTTSYWKNNRDRILGQMAVWFDRDETAAQFDINEDEDDCEYGAILPQVAVSGTLTRRAVEPTWMTASNAYEDRIGSELKGIIHAPPSCHFVGADVDSQELWIASVIGDASFTGIHGSTALGWMTLQGNKSAGTDMHSKTANLIGIGRDQAKILNYARIYGAGVTFAERLLSQFNKQLTALEAKSKAKTMYQMTKGNRKYLLNEEGRQLCAALEDLNEKRFEPLTKPEIVYLMNYQYVPSQHFMELVEKTAWDGGTESHMFNRLEEIANQECPKTPFLGCSISRSLIPSLVQNDFMTSRVNWVVQSSAVDYLHLMLTCMRWLIEKYEIDARFALSVHDEVRYIVKSEDRYRAALALQISNLLTRSLCSYQLGMSDLPMSVAYFSCIDIDKVLRKEVSHDCVTPSNPKGLSGGYGVPLGEGLDVEELLKITKGNLAKSV